MNDDGMSAGRDKKSLYIAQCYNLVPSGVLFPSSSVNLPRTISASLLTWEVVLVGGALHCPALDAIITWANVSLMNERISVIAIAVDIVESAALSFFLLLLIRA